MNKVSYLVFSLTVALILLSAQTSKAQFYVWLPSEPLTDSSADNTNPCLVWYIGNAWNENTILFWERADDSTQTAIWYRSLDDPTPLPQVLLSAPGVHFTHPVIMQPDDGYPPDTVFTLLYETDASGNKDIWYIRYHSNGSFSEPRLLAGEPGDDCNLCVASGWPGYISWENEGKILTSSWDFSTNSFTPATTLVYENGSNARVDEYMLTFLLQEDDSSKVMYFERENHNGVYSFTGPNELFVQGENSSIENCKGFKGWGGSVPGQYVWQNRQSGEPWGIVYAQFLGLDTYITKNSSPLYNYHSPDLFDFPIIIKSPTILTFVTDSTGNDEVMTSDPTGFYGIENQSDYPGPDRNPHFFSSSQNCVYQIQLLWESYRNGHWTIYRSHYDMIFGGDDPATASGITAYPNPFHDQLNIRTHASSGNKAIIFNQLSQPVRTLNGAAAGPYGGLEFIWDGLDDSDRPLPAGIYIIRIQSSHGPEYQKVIKR